MSNFKIVHGILDSAPQVKESQDDKGKQRLCSDDRVQTTLLESYYIDEWSEWRDPRI